MFKGNHTSVRLKPLEYLKYSNAEVQTQIKQTDPDLMIPSSTVGALAKWYCKSVIYADEKPH